MVRIDSVNTLDNSTVDIVLSNGNLILLDIGPLLAGDPAWAGLNAQALLPRPSTDGECIFWQDGPSLSLQEIFALLACDETGNTQISPGGTAP